MAIRLLLALLTTLSFAKNGVRSRPRKKTSYLDAVKSCILTKPSLTPQFNNSGVKSRYDDLLYTHIQQNILPRVSTHYSFDLEKRPRDVYGPVFLVDYDNVQGGNVNLDFEMTVRVSGPNVTVGDVMDTRKRWRRRRCRL
ncbi:hypothetical protein diail_6779 [Diaporthe ilicicola]|nr:hypothetical protein diail_6779 [Diaporthe ilicicola]